MGWEGGEKISWPWICELSKALASFILVSFTLERQI